MGFEEDALLAESGLIIAPDPESARLTRTITGTDQTGAARDIRIVEERPLTIPLNSLELYCALRCFVPNAPASPTNPLTAPAICCWIH